MSRNKPGHLAPHLPAIREAFERGQTTYAIAKEFGVTFQTIQHIRRGRNYAEGGTVPWATPPSKVVFDHCAWCRTGRRAAIIKHFLTSPHAEAKDVAKQYRMGYWYVQQIRARAMRWGCLPKRHECGNYLDAKGECAACARKAEAKPCAPGERWSLATHGGTMPWLLPPIGALYVRRRA